MSVYMCILSDICRGVTSSSRIFNQADLQVKKLYYLYVEYRELFETLISLKNYNAVLIRVLPAVLNQIPAGLKLVYECVKGSEPIEFIGFVRLNAYKKSA